jgi:hypothetical protein
MADKTKDAGKLQTEETLKKLYKEYDLTPADVFVNERQNFTIITRSGFQKIKAKANIQYTLEKISEIGVALPQTESSTNTKNYGVEEKEDGSKVEGRSLTQSESETITELFYQIAFKGRFWKAGFPDVVQEVTGSANTKTLPDHMAYYSEMAEKRCVARGVLTILGLYELGVYSEDEAEDFGKQVRDARKKGAVL